MNIFKNLYNHFTKDVTGRKIVAVILGNLILGVGAALLSYSLMGNEPYTAMNMAISGGLITWQTSNLGVGTIVGAFCFGPLINFFNKYNCKWIIK